MTTTTCKVRLTNDFHGSSVNVVGELVEMGHGTHSEDYDGQPIEGTALVRLTDGQQKRALKALCGVKSCRCGGHGPSLVPDGNPSLPTTWTVIGEVVK